ncbi:MAG: HNH endonuclease [Planctomycetes bacterium]|nr:HNH endonuclease [Planctomycetota bacterium]
MNSKYPVVARRGNHRCEYCRAPEAIFNFPFEVEHVFPTSRGGSDDESNLALTCRSCNLHKSDVVTVWDSVAEEEVALFNPRTDRWSEHFELELERGEIRGLTATGQATVTQLHLNDPIQLMARLLWIQLRLFP